MQPDTRHQWLTSFNMNCCCLYLTKDMCLSQNKHGRQAAAAVRLGLACMPQHRFGAWQAHEQAALHGALARQALMIGLVGQAHWHVIVYFGACLPVVMWCSMLGLAMRQHAALSGQCWLGAWVCEGG